MTTAVRWALVLAGVGMAAYGVLLISDFSPRDQLSVIIWAVGALLVHDAVIAPLYTVAGYAASRVLPPTAWAPLLIATAATMVLVAIAFPVLAPRPASQRTTNSTILDRPYEVSLGVAVIIIWVLAALIVIRNRRSTSTT